MASLPLGSDIYKTVLSGIENKCTETIKWKNDSDDSDDCFPGEIRTKTIQRTGKRNSYKLNRDKRNKNRVHWIDECENLPLASDKRFESDSVSKVNYKPILKCRANCVIIISE